MNIRTPVAELSLLGEEVHERLHEFYAYLHANSPVYLEPQTGIYVVSRFDDVRAMLIDTETFSSRNEPGALHGDSWKDYQAVLSEKGWSHMNTLQSADPPEHGRTRRILDRVFNTRRIQAQLPHVTQVANEVIDAFIDRGECEFVQDFAVPFPGRIISEQFGFDRGNVATFRKWSQSLAGTGGRLMDPDALRAAAELEVEMQLFLREMMEVRRRDPQDDLLSRLVQESDADGGGPLTMEEFQSVMRQVITGGYGTLTGAFINGMWLLLENPETMARIRADRSLLKPAIEEMIRIDTPNQGLMRTTTREVEVAGMKIPAGARVIARWGAANHDPAKFECPHKFDIERENAAAHISFGAGPHFCVGRVLARMELQVGFSTLLDRMDDIGLSRPLQDAPFNISIIHHHLRELPLKFKKLS